METVVGIAQSYLGKKEIKGNKGFEDKKFEKRMKEVGFQSGWAWCCLFAELCWISAFVDKKKELTKLFSASVMKTFRNFKGSKNYQILSEPIPGSLAVFQVIKKGKKHWTGHIGIVKEVNKDGTFYCIEGNSNSKGGREGIEVALKKRRDNSGSSEGLVLQGFIAPKK